MFINKSFERQVKLRKKLAKESKGHGNNLEEFKSQIEQLQSIFKRNS